MAAQVGGEGGGPGDGPRAFRFRPVFVGFLLSFPVVYACANAQVSSMFSLLVAPIGALMAVVLANAVLRLAAPRFCLDEVELVLIYAIVSVSGAVGAEWAWVGHSAYHMFPIAAETNPTVRDVVLPNMPDWLAVKDLEAVRDMAGGGHGMSYVAGKLPMYLPRYAAWGILYVSICLACLCINSLMRGAWCRSERLTFPLIQLPVAMSESGGAGPMWRSKLMWSAFAAMFAIDMLNGFSYLYPNLPNVPVKDLVDLDRLFTEPPWNQIGHFPIAIYPFMAAIAVFMPSDLIFSIVFFFLARKATHVILAANGIPQGTFSGTFVAPGPPYFDEQTWGGVLALFVGAIWVSRVYLREVWRDIRTGRKPEDGGIPHRWAFVGLAVCFAAVVAFGMLGTLPVAYMIPYVGVFLVFSVVLTRIRAQLGPPTHEFAFFGPNSIMHRFLGNQWLTDRQVVWVNQGLFVMNRIHRTHPMPYQLEAMKMGDREGLSKRRLFWSIAAATVLAYFLSQFLLHVYSYRTGQTQRWSEGLSYIQVMLANRKGPDVVGISMTLFGFSVVLLLDIVRFRVPAFPLHPAGYVLSMNYGVDYYWFGLLIVMLLKNFVQRYYGLRGYDKLRNVALGILVAEYAAETIWMATALVTHQNTYTISFNERGLGGQ